MDQSKPLGRRNYAQFARRYAEHAATKPHNALYERPATLSLLPDVAGRRVLDAGCGPGFYAEELLRRGAEVVAVDVTPEMVDLARARVGTRATVRLADLGSPLDFAADAEFDVVVAPLVLDYLEDWGAVFSEFFRVLVPGGVLVHSHGHPMSDWRVVKAECDPDSRYFEVEEFELAWRGFGEPHPRVRSFRRPLSAMLNPLIDAGFVIERVLEPMPLDECRRVAPEEYEQLTREPCFLFVRARKPGSAR